MKTLLRPAHTDVTRLESFARYASDRVTSLEGQVMLWQNSHAALLRRQTRATARLRLVTIIAVVLASLFVTALCLLFHLTRLSGR